MSADDPLEDALPRCPRCLVVLDAEGEAPLIWLRCPVCDDVFL